MGLPSERFQTFAQGDIPAMAFWNEWLQDHMVQLRNDVDDQSSEVTTQGSTLTSHLGSSSNPHGSVQTVSGKYVAPLFESSSPAETRWLDTSAFNGDGEQVQAFTVHGGLYLTAEDLLTHKLVAPLALRPGDVLTGIDVYANRTAGALTVKVLKRDPWGDSTTVAETSISGTGDVGANWTGSHTITSSFFYQVRVEMANAGTSSNLYFYGVKVSFNRTRR